MKALLQTLRPQRLFLIYVPKKYTSIKPFEIVIVEQFFTKALKAIRHSVFISYIKILLYVWKRLIKDETPNKQYKISTVSTQKTRQSVKFRYLGCRRNPSTSYYTNVVNWKKKKPPKRNGNKGNQN